MSTISKKVEAAAAGAGGGSAGGYLAVAVDKTTDGNQWGVQVFDNTDPSSLTLAVGYLLRDDRSGYSVSFNSVGDYSDYLAVASSWGTVGGEYFNTHLLDHSTAGSLSGLDTYSVSGNSNVSAYACKFSNDNNYIAVGSQAASELTLLSPSGGSLSSVTSYALGGANSYATYLDWNSDDSYLVVGYFNTNSGGPNVTLVSHSSGSLSFADSYTAAVGNSNEVYTVAFSPDGNYIAVGSGYNSGTASATFTLLDHTTAGSLSLADTYTFPDAINSVDFSPDGNYIAVGFNAATSGVTLLDHTTPGSVSFATSYATPDGAAVKFSPTGDYLAVGENRNDDLILLDHTTPGSLSFSSSYNLNNLRTGQALSFSVYPGLGA